MQNLHASGICRLTPVKDNKSGILAAKKEDLFVGYKSLF
jgi:hypothetical protein